jgi:hypothetical protein
MDCNECHRLENLFLESIMFADRAQTELRCYFLTHRHCAGVSDLAEYDSLSREERRTAQERDQAYIDLATHRKGHA